MRIRATIQRVTQTTGFTLVELLVVIVLIALLASLLTPALQRSFADGKTMGCLGKLRAMGAAIHLYGADTGNYPKTDYDIISGTNVTTIAWAYVIYPYMFNEAPPPPKARRLAKKQFTCPAARQDNVGDRTALLSYQYNLRMGSKGEGPPVPRAAVPSPSTTFVIADGRQAEWTYLDHNTHDLISPQDILRDKSMNGQGIQPHLKKNNWLFADGHVATLNVEDTCRQPRDNANPRKYWSIDPND